MDSQLNRERAAGGLAAGAGATGSQVTGVVGPCAAGAGAAFAAAGLGAASGVKDIISEALIFSSAILIKILQKILRCGKSEQREQLLIPEEK